MSIFRKSADGAMRATVTATARLSGDGRYIALLETAVDTTAGAAKRQEARTQLRQMEQEGAEASSLLVMGMAAKPGYRAEMRSNCGFAEAVVTDGKQSATLSRFQHRGEKGGSALNEISALMNAGVPVRARVCGRASTIGMADGSAHAGIRLELSFPASELAKARAYYAYA